MRQHRSAQVFSVVEKEEEEEGEEVFSVVETTTCSGPDSLAEQFGCSVADAWDQVSKKGKPKKAGLVVVNPWTLIQRMRSELVKVGEKEAAALEAEMFVEAKNLKNDFDSLEAKIEEAEAMTKAAEEAVKAAAEKAAKTKADKAAEKQV